MLNACMQLKCYLCNVLPGGGQVDGVGTEPPLHHGYHLSRQVRYLYSTQYCTYRTEPPLHHGYHLSRQVRYLYSRVQ